MRLFVPATGIYPVICMNSDDSFYTKNSYLACNGPCPLRFSQPFPVRNEPRNDPGTVDRYNGNKTAQIFELQPEEDRHKKVLKWIGIVLGGLVSLLVVVIIGSLIYRQMSFKRTYANRPFHPITADTSTKGMVSGKYLAENVMSCDEACHSQFGQPFAGGSEAIHEGSISGVFAVPNLTPDQETGLSGWSDAEVARAIREGIDKDRNPWQVL